MKPHLLVGEHVASHPDGTATILRAGITRIEVGPGDPPVIDAGVLARFDLTAKDVGKHKLGLLVRGPDKSVVEGSEVAATADVRSGQSFLNFILNLHLLTLDFGTHTIEMYLDDRKVASTFLDVRRGRDKS